MFPFLGFGKFVAFAFGREDFLHDTDRFLFGRPFLVVGGVFASGEETLRRRHLGAIGCWFVVIVIVIVTTPCVVAVVVGVVVAVGRWEVQTGRPSRENAFPESETEAPAGSSEHCQDASSIVDRFIRL